MLRTRVVWTGVAGTPYYSTFYWAGAGPTAADNAQDATILWAQNWETICIDALSAQVESEVLEINELTGVQVALYDVPGSTTEMLNVGQPLPFQVQALTFLGTTDFKNGRRVRGRSFLPGLPEDIQTSGVGPTEVFRETIQGVYSGVLGGAAAVHVVWSRPVDGAGGSIHPVSSYQTSPIWSTLRTRRPA